MTTSVRTTALTGSLKILIPLYATYLIFALSIFVYFIPQLKVHMLDQKKNSIRQLTDSVISLLSEFETRVADGSLTREEARSRALNQVRGLRYGPEGKDYFWINDLHPFMIMHPYRPDLEGRDLTLFTDSAGNYPFMAMVETVMQHGDGYVNYVWQWKDQPGRDVPKISYVKEFAPWGWIVGTGLYVDDIAAEISLVNRQFIDIFGVVLALIILLSGYIARQVFRSEEQRYAAEEDLRNSEERYRILAENAADMIWILRLSDFSFSYVSPSVERLLGYHSSEFINLAMGDHISRTSLDAVARVIEEELARDSADGVDPDRSRVIEVEMIRKNQTICWGEVTARFLRNDSGTPDRILGITRDITERKHLEEKLRHSNQELRLAQRIAGIGSWSYNPDSGTHIWSDEFCRILELDPAAGPDSLDGIKSPIAEEFLQSIDQATRQAMETGESYERELKIGLEAGSEKWIHIICEPALLPEKEHFRLCGTIQDITARKRMESRIQQTQKMEALGTLSGGIAHDFNNILSSIIGFTELAKSCANDDEVQENLDQVVVAGLRARDLVRHILTFSRRADVTKQPLNLVPLIKESLKFLRASAPPSIEIRYHLPENAVVVLSDPTQMHQVLMNLFTNAVQAMSRTGGLLDVTLTSMDLTFEDRSAAIDLSPGRYVQLLVSDTGCGIPKHLAEKIFEPFFTTRKREEGTGLGLSTIYGIIREMQGSISVYSEPGEGATFRVLVPEHGGDAPLEGSKREKEVVAGTGRILLVDDEVTIVRWTSRMLMQMGYEVTGVTESKKALAIFQKDPHGFDLVLTDFSMPRMSGLDLAQEIRKKSPGIPIVLITGFSEGILPEKLESLSIQSIIMKPMIAGELARAIQGAFTKDGGKA